MTEDDWLRATSAKPMLLGLIRRGMSDRRFRMFSVACARSNWAGLTDDHARNAVGLAEYVADGKADEKARAMGYNFTEIIRDDTQRLWAQACLRASASGGAMDVATHLAAPGQASILRDIAGTPTRYFVVDGTPREVACAAPGSLWSPHWTTPDVRDLALSAYEGRDDDGTLSEFTLSLLRDALEEAGCDNEYVLRHLDGEQLLPVNPLPHRVYAYYPGTATPLPQWGRMRGPHVKGCWVVDLCLGLR